MVRKDKVRVCEMRLQGMSIYQIAPIVQRSPQSVFVFVSHLPFDKTKKYARPKIDTDTMLEICDEHFKGVTVPVLAEIYNMSVEDVESIFGYIASRRRKNRDISPYYPKISKWMMENSYGTSDLAEACGVPARTVQRALSGKFGDLMSYELAEKISNFTGLSFSDIFTVQIGAETTPKA